MFECDYLVEILTPKRIDGQSIKASINLFAERYYRVFDAAMGISVPDNPMGQPRYGLLEMIEQARLRVVPQRTVMNLNTFHTKDELDGLLRTAARLGIKYLLVVRGDGGPQLPKLDPKSIGGLRSIVASIDLIRYINTEYDGKFVTGAAFNQYNPVPFESDRLKQKIEAGAKFVITQPVIGKDQTIDSLYGFGVPVVVEAWMSENVDLLFKSVRQNKDERALTFDPIKNLQILHEAYRNSCIYLSMLGFKQEWKPILPRL